MPRPPAPCSSPACFFQIPHLSCPSQTATPVWPANKQLLRRLKPAPLPCQQRAPSQHKPAPAARPPCQSSSPLRHNPAYPPCQQRAPSQHKPAPAAHPPCQALTLRRNLPKRPPSKAQSLCRSPRSPSRPPRIPSRQLASQPMLPPRPCRRPKRQTRWQPLRSWLAASAPHGSPPNLAPPARQLNSVPTCVWTPAPKNLFKTRYA